MLLASALEYDRSPISDKAKYDNVGKAKYDNVGSLLDDDLLPSVDTTPSFEDLFGSKGFGSLGLDEATS